MAERPQYTSPDRPVGGELQDNVSARDGKAGTLAHDVTEREALEKRTALIILAAMLFVVVMSFTALAFGLQKVNEIAASNQRVTCSLRSGYVEQLKGTKKFLKANPHGGTLLGVHFTRADLVRQRDGLQKRVDSTKDAKC